MATRFLIKFGGTYGTETRAGTVTLPTDAFVTDHDCEAVIMSDCSNGEIGELRIRTDLRPETAFASYEIGQLVQVVDTDATDEMDDDGEKESFEIENPTDDGTVVFQGVIVKKNVGINGKGTTFDLVAYNTGDWFLHRKIIHGQLRRSHTLEQSWFNAGDNSGAQSLTVSSDTATIDTPMVLNPSGSPNATKQTYFVASEDDDDSENNTFRLFEAPFRNQYNASGDHLVAVPWRIKDAIKYILNFNSATWCIDPISYSDTTLDGVFGTDTADTNPILSEVNLEGRSLAEALRCICEPYNYVYNVLPDAVSGLHTIKFSQRGAGTNCTVRLEERDANALTSTANLISAELLFDSTAVVNSTEAYGAQISVTTLAHTDPPAAVAGAPQALLLVKGWKDSILTIPTFDDGITVNTFDQTFRKSYCTPDLIKAPDADGSGAASGGGGGGGGSGSGADSDSGQPYGVGRMWIVNLGEVPNQPLEDLSAKLFVDATDSNSIDPRRFEKPQLYTQNSAGGQLAQSDITVEISTDAGTNFGIVDPSWYRVLSNNLGIVFYPQNLEKLGVLIPCQDVPTGRNYWQALHDAKLQIRVLCIVKSDERVAAQIVNDGTACPLAREGQIENQGYRIAAYNDAIDDAVYFTDYAPLELNQDDSTALTNLLKQSTALSNRLMISGKLVVLLETFGEYRPGFKVSNIDNRDAIDLTPPPTILRVIYHFNEGHAELILDNKQVKSIVRAKPSTGDDRREHQLGVEGTHPMSGGHHVAALPGDLASMKAQFLAGGGEQ